MKLTMWLLTGDAPVNMACSNHSLNSMHGDLSKWYCTMVRQGISTGVIAQNKARITPP